MMRLIRPTCLLLLFLTQATFAETFAELTKREEGIALGRCELLPRPDLKGMAIHAVIPARFEVPGIWSTRRLLLVGIDEAGTVLGSKELQLGMKVPPREVLKVHCSENRLELRMSPQASRRTLVHRWDGRDLRLEPRPR